MATAVAQSTGRILMASWNGRVTELLLKQNHLLWLIAQDVNREEAEQIAKQYGIALDVRPGAFR